MELIILIQRSVREQSLLLKFHSIPTTMIKVMIADDHQMFVDGVKAILSQIENLEVIGEANDGEALLKLIAVNPPDVVLMDMNMPALNGLETTKIIVERYPSVKVIMLTMHDSSDYIQRLIKAGANGYVLKNTGKEELKLAIETVHAGDSYYSKEVTQRIMDAMNRKKEVQTNVMNVELTEREMDVLKLIAAEMTTNEIADKLCISSHTVETHRKNLISKLQVRNSMGLVKYAMQMGYVD